MNKPAKYCVECQESYADRFGFCPVCGTPLEAPAAVAKTTENIIETKTFSDFNNNSNVAKIGAVSEKTVELRTENSIAEQIPVITESKPVEAETIYPNGNGASAAKKVVEETKTFAKAASVGAITNGYGSNNGAKISVGNAANDNFTAATGAKEDFYSEIDARYFKKPDDLYHLTIIEKPKAFQRVMTFGGLLGLVVLLNAFIALWVLDILKTNPMIESPEEYGLITFVAEDPYEQDPDIPKKNTDKGGGGGGGGRNDPKPASFGREAPQMRTPPLVTPSKDLVVKKDGALPVMATTVGDPKPNKQDLTQPLGVTTGKKNGDLSDGSGDGRGQGNGKGNGQGNGEGDGKGNGKGTGSGGGDGNGNGDGKGDGDNGDAPKPPPTPRPKPPATPPPPAPVGPSVGVNVTSKPRPGYTEDARKNQIQGTVRLRVTFNANGTIGSISPISGLGYGLTDKAIEAARQMRFEPAKRGGVPYAVTKEVAYTFNLL